MSAKKRALGRGLDSLIGPAQNTPEKTAPGPGDNLLEVPTAQVRPNINQPRTEFDDAHIDEMARSIAEVGILQPLLVRKQDDHYELIAGERRLRGAQSAGLEKVPVRITDATDERSFEMALIENVQREDLNPLEEARAYHSLMEQFKLTQEDVAKRVGKNRSTVANALRLLHLPHDVQEDVLVGRLSPGHARAILSLSEPARQRALRNQIIAKSLSVREAEAAARTMERSAQKTGKAGKDKKQEALLRDLQESLSTRIGLPVTIKARSKKAGTVEIRYTNLDDFETITDFFGVETS